MTVLSICDTVAIMTNKDESLNLGDFVLFVAMDILAGLEHYLFIFLFATQ